MNPILLFLRTVFGLAIISLSMPFYALIIGFSGETPRSEWALRTWCRLTLRIAGVELIFKQLAPLDKKRSYVFISNHTSNMDVPAILSCTPEPIRFIAKKELASLPFFGWAARRMGHVFIDRQNKQGASKAIRRRIELGLGGIGLFFFAEGTRSTTEELLPFKKGAAVAAIETGLDCVPIGVAGAQRVLAPKGLSLLRPGPIAVVFGPPIPIAGHTLEERDRLVVEQRKAVESVVAEARALLAQRRGS